jgi:hypothetical protein
LLTVLSNCLLCLVTDDCDILDLCENDDENAD